MRPLNTALQYMVISSSHLVTFPAPIMSILPAVAPNTLALASGWNLPFLESTFQSLDPRSRTRYGGCSAEDIAAYTRPIPSLRPQASKADATRWLTTFLVDQWPSQEVVDALNDIDQVFWTPMWGPEMLIQISRDLDTAFFHGCLRGSIKVSWEDVNTTPFLGSNLMEVLGITRFDENDNICYILLNRYAIQGGPIEPKTQTVQTLIHEMVVNSNMTKPLDIVLTCGLACLEFPLFP